MRHSLPYQHPLAPTAGKNVRTGAVFSVTLGLVLLSLPLSAQASEAATYTVTLETAITDGVATDSLGGVQVTIRKAEGDQAALATGITRSDGTLDLDVRGVETSYIADAEWLGAPGGLEHASARTEFLLGDQAPVELLLWGAFGTVSGTIAVTVDGAPLADLTGSAVAVESAGVALQTLPLASDGSFTSHTLPANELPDYALSFVPPTGYELADVQAAENLPFALPAGTTSPSTISITRMFAVIATDTVPSPEPTPTPVPTPTPAPTPTPVPTPTPTPVPTPTPAPTDPATSFGDADSVGSALGGSSEAQLTSLLAATSQNDQAVPITSQSGQVLGFAWQPATPQQQSDVGALVGSVAALTASNVAVRQPRVVAMDIESMMLALQQDRNAALEKLLIDAMEGVQQRNVQMSALNTAITSVRDFLSAPSESTFAAAVAATKASGIDDPFFTASPENRKSQASALVTQLAYKADMLVNAQQMDAIRLQSLITKRNEAFETMTNFIKKMQDARTSIIGNMRSTPVALGSVQWGGAGETGRFDLTAVPDGQHHLILDFEAFGTTVISSVDVQRGQLAATGMQATPTVWVGAALLTLGGIALISEPLRRRHRTAP